MHILALIVLLLSYADGLLGLRVDLSSTPTCASGLQLGHPWVLIIDFMEESEDVAPVSKVQLSRGSSIICTFLVSVESRVGPPWVLNRTSVLFTKFDPNTERILVKFDSYQLSDQGRWDCIYITGNSTIAKTAALDINSCLHSIASGPTNQEIRSKNKLLSSESSQRDARLTSESLPSAADKDDKELSAEGSTQHVTSNSSSWVDLFHNETGLYEDILANSSDTNGTAWSAHAHGGHSFFNLFLITLYAVGIVALTADIYSRSTVLTGPAPTASKEPVFGRFWTKLIICVANMILLLSVVITATLYGAIFMAFLTS